MPPLFVTFEGPEGAGKSTQVGLLAAALADRKPLVVREPGGTELGERVRKLVLGGRHGISAEAEMHLFMAARAELLARRVRPALEEGGMVIADRYHDSTLAYQGGGRGASTFWPASFPRPDRTYLLVLPPEIGLERGRRRGEVDRLESEPLDFHRRVVAEYERLAAAEPARYLRLDATLDARLLHEQVLGDVEAWLEEGVATSS